MKHASDDDIATSKDREDVLTEMALKDATQHSDLNRADTAISSIEEDRLGRDTFAIDIANSIRNLPGTDGIVIAVDGKWGEGKTSVLNMVREALEDDIESVEDLPGKQTDQTQKGAGTRERWRALVAWFHEGVVHLRNWSSRYFWWGSTKERRLQVLMFEPWQLSGIETITRSLFQDMGRVIGRADTSRETKRLGAQMEQLAVAFGAAEDAAVQSAFKKLWRFGIGVGSALGLTWSVSGCLGFNPEWIFAVFQNEWVISISVFVISMVGLVAAVAGRIAEVLRIRTEVQAKTTEELRGDVKEGLEEREHPLVVFIDDVDRLSFDEVMVLFKLIRASGRFPNVIYVLGLDKQRILNHDDEVDDGYLEKIIQETHVLPILAEGEVKEYASEILLGDELLGSSSVDFSPSADERWGPVFSLVAGAYFKTLRDVNRFAGSFRLQIGRFVRDGHFEANVTDLFVLHVIRNFEPLVFQRLVESKKLLCEAPDRSLVELDRSLDDVQSKGMEEEVPKQQRERDLNTLIATPNDEATVRRALTYLFPYAAEALLQNETSQNVDHSAWLWQHRVAHPLFFRSYFEQRPASGPLLRSEEETLEKALQSEEKLRECLNEYHKKKRLLESLCVLRDRVESGNLNRIQHRRIAVDLARRERSLETYDDGRDCDLDLIGEPNTALGMADEIVKAILGALSSEHKKKELTRDLIQNEAFWLAGQEIERLEEKQKEWNDATMSEDLLSDLKRQYADAVWSRVESSHPESQRTIDERWDVADLILRLFEWGDAERATSWFREQVERGNLHSIATHFCEAEQAEPSGESRECNRDFLSIIDGSLSTEDLRDEVVESARRALDESSTGEDNRQVMLAVQRLIKKSSS